MELGEFKEIGDLLPHLQTLKEEGIRSIPSLLAKEKIPVSSGIGKALCGTECKGIIRKQFFAAMKANSNLQTFFTFAGISKLDNLALSEGLDPSKVWVFFCVFDIKKSFALTR